MSASIISCGRDLPGELAESEHFRYYYRKGDEPCDAVLHRLDRHLELTSEFLGIQVAREKKIEYYKFTDSSDIEKNACRRAATNTCTDGTKVFSTQWVDYRELVHSYTSLLGNPPNIFKDGIAEVLACLYMVVPPHYLIEQDVPIEEIIDNSEFNKRFFLQDNLITTWDVAAAFTRYLLDRFGTERWRNFYAIVPRNADQEKTSECFLDAFGVFFQDAVDDWRTYLPMAPWKNTICLVECGGDPPVLPSETPAERNRETTCVPDFIPIEVWEDGDVDITLSGNAEMSLYPCMGSGGEWFVPFGYIPPGRSLIKLVKGSYYCEFRPASLPDEEGHVSYPEGPYDISFSFGSSPIGDTCSTANIVTVDVSAPLTIIAGNADAVDNYPNERMPGAGDRVVRFEVTRHVRFYPFSTTVFDHSVLTLCHGDLCPGDGDESCEEFPGDRSFTELYPGENYSLIIDSVPENYGMYRVVISFRDPL